MKGDLTQASCRAGKWQTSPPEHPNICLCTGLPSFWPKENNKNNAGSFFSNKILLFTLKD